MLGSNWGLGIWDILVSAARWTPPACSWWGPLPCWWTGGDKLMCQAEAGHLVTSGRRLEQNRTRISVTSCWGRKETELWQYSWSDRLRSSDNPAVGLKTNRKQQQSTFLYKSTEGNFEYNGEGRKIWMEAKSHRQIIHPYTALLTTQHPESDRLLERWVSRKGEAPRFQVSEAIYVHACTGAPGLRVASL